MALLKRRLRKAFHIYKKTDLFDFLLVSSFCLPPTMHFVLEALHKRVINVCRVTPVALNVFN
jgi:hypothetical protein